MSSFITKRRRGYYATLNIPVKLQDHFGKTRFIRTLQTDSLAVAKKRAPVHIAAWKAQIDEAMGHVAQDDVEYWRRQLQAAQEPQEKRRLEAVVEHLAEEKAGPVYVHAAGVEPVEDPDQAVAAEQAAQKWHRDVLAVRLADHVNDWGEQSGLTPKTLASAKRDVMLFIQDHPTGAHVTHEAAQQWLDELATEKAYGTCKKRLAYLRGLWKYLRRKKLVEGKPFDDLDMPRRNGNGNRRPFTAEDIKRLWRAADGSSSMQDLIALAAHTGCRIEEICSLRVENVTDEVFRIVDAKTEAGIREVPIHKDIAKRVAYLKAKSEDGYLLSGQKENQWGQRSTLLSQNFTKLKRKLGYGDEHVFHSIRKFVATCLQEAEVPEPLAANIMGHEIRTITYGVYSGGASNKAKREALEKAIRILV